MQTKLAGAVLAGRWRLLERLGAGAEAETFRALDQQSGAEVALKALRGPADAAARERLRLEFAALSSIDHPNLVRVFDLALAEEGGPLGGRMFFTAELLVGDSPSLTLRERPAEERAERLTQLIAEVASALEALHQRGLLHHDVKPANLLLDASGRVHLSDLGLAGESGGAPRGSPGYWAPEVLAHEIDARADLFSLGATAWELWTGRPMRRSPGGNPLLDEILRGDEPERLDRSMGAPTGLAELIAALCRADPARRPSSARAVIEEATRLGGRLAGRALPAPAPRPVYRPSLAGRSAELEQALAALALGGPRLVLIAGAPGSGRSRLSDELRRKTQLLAAARGQSAPAWHGPTLDAAARTLGLPATPTPGAWCRRLAESPSVLHLESAAPLELELAALIARGAAGATVAVLEGPRELRLTPALESSAWLVRLTLEPLGAEPTAALVASMTGVHDAAFARAIWRASGGEPRLAVELVRRAAALAGSDAPGAAHVSAAGGTGLTALVRAQLVRAAPEVRRTLEALAVSGRPSAISELSALLAEPEAQVFSRLAAAHALGLCELRTDRAQFPSLAHAAAALAVTSPARRALLHTRALALPPLADPLDQLLDRARHLVAVGPPDQALAAALTAARATLAAGWPARAEEPLRAALALTPSPLPNGGAGVGAGGSGIDRGAEVRLLLAEARTLCGDYAGVREALAPLDDHEDPQVRARAALAAARPLQRSGDHAAVEKLLAPLLEMSDVAAGERAEARGLLCRVQVARGAFEEARALAERGLQRGERGSALEEAHGLALLYLGRFDEAETCFAALERGAATAVQQARARSLGGMVAQAREDLPAAAEAYAAALALAQKANDLHGEAIYGSNLGATLREQAEYARALEPTQKAAADLERLGKDLEHAGALFNCGNLLLSIGDLDGAAAAAARARSIADGAGARREGGYARLLDGDLARRRGDLPAAAAAYREALATFGDAPRERILALRSLAEALAESTDAAGARHHMAEAQELASAHGLSSLCAAAAVRVALWLDEPVPADALAALDNARAHAARTHRRDLAFRADVDLARAAIRAGDPRVAARHVSRARDTWEEIVMRTPELRRDAAAEDPDAKRLRALLEATGPAPALDAERAHDERYRHLLGINKRLNSELRLPRVLELILDTVIELTSAERGFILLAAKDGALQIELARDMDHASLEGASFSRSIAERAAREGTPMVTLDAAGDARFEAALSISHLRLRSVLAVPLQVKGRVVGCVYADHRLRKAAFGDADVALVCDLAEQAAIAIENARLVAENEQQRVELEDRSRKLAEQVESQAVELGELHREVEEGRAALTVRYDYRNLVGRTPRMLELFRLLDRVTDTHLPVVIYGESGTGKELAARAIHHNGPRKQKPFVSESCAAIPETLLEAALFGHVRGAFTGADSERRGLFEVAHGGTLFLDEVGEMSPAMQAKLLRVLQSGELRRLGGERTLQVDVRVLAASNRDLGRLVEEGRFREDLYYRLNVVRVALPPLRERREDVPLLIEHFLRKHAEASGQPPRRIARAALSRLIAYRWPGNVRELENEILRAAALGGETIVVQDLSPQVASGEPEAASGGDDALDLRPRVERLERTLIREALGRTSGNQTQAARLLGLSRFGLQKKLRRYHLAT